MANRTEEDDGAHWDSEALQDGQENSREGIFGQTGQSRGGGVCFDPSSPSIFLPRTVCSPLVVHVLRMKFSKLKELEMFLEELASERVLANLILESFSLAKEPIGFKGIAEPPLRWRTARELSFVLRTSL